MGELAGTAKEGLLALSVGVGLGVLAELMAEEVDDVVGPKGRHDVERSAVRHGHEGGEVTLGGRRVPVDRPRVRARTEQAIGLGALTRLAGPPVAALRPRFGRGSPRGGDRCAGRRSVGPDEKWRVPRSVPQSRAGP